ncbi:MAG: hypothetical protein IKL46_01620 [Clostridia bacterium]|nr:hypothetical protein [Clostridia bacterium]
MKKLFALLLTLTVVLTLSACNNKGGRSDNNSSGKATPPSSAENTNDKTTPAADNTTSDTGSVASQEYISRDRAIELALSHAGLLHRSDIYDLDAELDREYGGVFWEVDFENGGYDYSYEINAVTEEIVRHQKERD